MENKQKKSWFEKYGTAVSIFVSTILTISGWLYSRRIERENDLRTLKNTYISNAFKEISFYSTLLNFKLTTKDDFLRFEKSMKDIQLYGTVEEIKAAHILLKSLATSGEHDFDPLLNLLRNNLRNEFDLGPTDDKTFWILDTAVYKNSTKD